MGSAHSTPKTQSAEDVSKSKRKNKKSNKKKELAPRNVKILMLGAGEAGKSTFLKQVRVIYGPGYSRTECLMYRHIVVKNAIQSLMAIINAMSPLEVQFSRDDIIGIAREFLDNAEATVYRGILSPEMAQLMKTLWEDPGLKICYDRSREYQLNDSASYFLNNLERISRPGYIPSVQDVLRTRVSTDGCEEEQFTIKGLNIKILTFGGYIDKETLCQSFKDVTVLMFCVPLSAYDVVMDEDDLNEGEDANKLRENMKMFDVICNSRWFINTPIITLYNKKDIFETKLSKIPLTVCFPEYKGDKSFEEASKYIQDKFESTIKATENRKIFSFMTCATDTDNVTQALTSIANFISDLNLDSYQLL